MGNSVSCPLSLKSCIIDWVEYRDLLWTFDLIMYHIRSMHCMCIDPWGQSANMIVEIWWCRVTPKMGHVSSEDVVTESHPRWDMYHLTMSWLSYITVFVVTPYEGKTHSGGMTLWDRDEHLYDTIIKGYHHRFYDFICVCEIIMRSCILCTYTYLFICILRVSVWSDYCILS